MKKLYELRDKLCEQLEEYREKDITSATLETIDTLAHAIKNIDKIIDRCEENEYSNGYSNNYYYPRYAYGGGMSYPRGGNRGGNMGGYSRGYNTNDMIHELNMMMNDIPDDRTRNEFQKFIQKMQNM